MRDRDYYYRRAEAELLMAERAVVPEAVLVHYKLAEFYLALVQDTDEDPAEIIQRIALNG